MIHKLYFKETGKTKDWDLPKEDVEYLTKQYGEVKFKEMFTGVKDIEVVMDSEATYKNTPLADMITHPEYKWLDKPFYVSVSDFMEDGTVRQTQTYPNYIHVIELPDSVATRFGVKYDMTITNFQYYTPTEEQTECIVVVFNDPNDSNDGESALIDTCLLYTSPSPRDRTRSRMPSSA